MDCLQTQQRCSFCGKGTAEVTRLMTGRGDAAICHECLARCAALLAALDREEADLADDADLPVT
jgi:ribosomal protein L24E